MKDVEGLWWIDFGWESGVALQALTDFLSSPDRQGGLQLYLSLWAESPHLVTEINQDTVCQLKSPHVCL